LKVKLSDRRVQLVVVAALSLVVVNNARYFVGRSKTGQQPLEIEMPVFEATLQSEAPRWASANYTDASDWGRDPFDPTGGAGAPRLEFAPSGSRPEVRTPRPPRLDITGIGTVGGSRFVLSGDRILRVGDRIGTATIREIGTASVVVEYGGTVKRIKID
jgi:hypothetical protein